MKTNADNTNKTFSDDIEIIDKPAFKPFLRDVAEWSFTLSFWAFWVYLLLPVINMIAWLIAGQIIFKTVIVEAGYEEFFDILAKWGFAAITAIMVFVSWGYYNYWKYGLKNRRKTSSPVTLEETASFFKTTRETITCMQATKIMEITVDEPKKPGKIRRVGEKDGNFC